MNELETLLAGQHLVINSGDLNQAHVVIATLVACWVMEKGKAKSEHNDWRVYLMSPRFGRTTNLLYEIRQLIPVYAPMRWGESYLYTPNGMIKCIDPEPENIMGVTGWNILYVVLDCRSDELWDMLTACVVKGTSILALNPPEPVEEVLLSMGVYRG